MSAMVECSAPCEVALEAFHPGISVMCGTCINGHPVRLHRRPDAFMLSMASSRIVAASWSGLMHHTDRVPRVIRVMMVHRRAGSIAEWIKQRRPWGSLHAQCRFHGRVVRAGIRRLARPADFVLPGLAGAR
jgi:hypothetical protein